MAKKTETAASAPTKVEAVLRSLLEQMPHVGKDEATALLAQLDGDE